MKDIIILGSSGFAQEVEWLISRINQREEIWNFLGFIDNKRNGNKVIGNDDWLMSYEKKLNVVCAIGNSKVRKDIISKFSKKANFFFPTLIDPSVIYSDSNKIGSGTIICAGTIMTVNVKIGSHVIVNLDSTIGHSAQIDDFCTLYPSVNISGDVKLKKSVEIGTGSHLIQGVCIGEEAIIGAGSAVIKDIPPKCTAVGVPAKPIKFTREA